MVPTSVDEKFSRPNPADRWQRFSIRFKLILYSFTQEVKTVPKSVHKFLSQMTIGQLRIPEEFLLPFEKEHINETLGVQRKLIPAHLHPDFKDKRNLMGEEIEKRKRQMTLMIGAFVISKVFVQDVFNNRHILETAF